MQSIPLHTLPRLYGKHLISPLSRLDETGRHRASVSIRSGQGSATHDRVMRFALPFESRDSALRYAAEQGLLWLQQHRPAALPLSLCSQE
ncbi:MAG: hypothetical protein RIQ96_468 [Pseudomonadota bacterium]|jgi:hypothetical protein